MHPPKSPEEQMREHLYPQDNTNWSTIIMFFAVFAIAIIATKYTGLNLLECLVLVAFGAYLLCNERAMKKFFINYNNPNSML